jgi:hypothetical protein
MSGSRKVRGAHDEASRDSGGPVHHLATRHAHTRGARFRCGKPIRLGSRSGTQNGPGILDGGGREYSSRRRRGVALRHVNIHISVRRCHRINLAPPALFIHHAQCGDYPRRNSRGRHLGHPGRLGRESRKLIDLFWGGRRPFGNLAALDVWAAAAPSGRCGRLCHREGTQNAHYQPGPFGWLELDAVEIFERSTIGLDTADRVFQCESLADDIGIV